MIPEGKYTARGGEGALTTSKDKGTPAVQVIMEIAEGEFAGDRMRYDGWLTDAAAQRTLESLRYMGWVGDDLTNLDGIATNLVQIVVEHETRDVNGEMKTYPRIKWVNKLGGGAKIMDEARMGDAAAKALAQRFKAQARGVPVVGSKPATKPTNGGTKHTERADPLAGADFGDDNIPFSVPFSLPI